MTGCVRTVIARQLRRIAAVGILLFALAPLGAQEAPLWDEKTAPSSDWIQLTSREWLRGRLLGMFDDELEFDSSKFDLWTFEWKDVLQVRTARVMEVGLVDGTVAIGRLVLIDQQAKVVGSEPREFARSAILTINPSGDGKPNPLRHWSGRVSFGLTLLSGNVDQVDLNLTGGVKRRSVADRVALDYFANFSRAEGTDIADNQRLNGSWHHFITSRFFVQPLAFEAYRDPFLNLESRTTAGAGAGYQLIDTRRRQWEVSIGFGYQRTRFDDVAEGESDGARTGTLIGGMKYEHDVSKRIELDAEYTFHLTTEAAGRYHHHAVLGVETDWTDALDVDVTLVWDRTQLPQPGSDGVVPDQDDLRMVLALGLEF